jgi:lipase chaperone LimK
MKCFYIIRRLGGCSGRVACLAMMLMYCDYKRFIVKVMTPQCHKLFLLVFR